MTRLFLEPLDVWLFRDGRPFTARADHYAQSLFPPSPLTLYGALRTKLLFDAAARTRASVADAEFARRTVGAPDDFTRLRLRGPFPARRAGQRVVRYLPAPLDLVTRDAPVGQDATWALLAPETAVPGLETDLGLALPWLANGRPGAGGGWLEEEDFFATLAGEPRPALEAKCLFTTEWRHGIELAWDDGGRQRKTVREGHLYAVGFTRTAQGVGLCVDVEGWEPPTPSGLIGLGGEARGSRYEVVSATLPDRRRAGQRVTESGRLKVVLAAPALFSNGWLPSWVDPATLRGQRPAEGLRLVAAAVNRPEPVGGFDVVAGRPRAIQPAAPAGSVYWFEEVQPGAAGRAFGRLDGMPISDAYPEIGFGLCYAGVW